MLFSPLSKNSPVLAIKNTEWKRKINQVRGYIDEHWRIPCHHTLRLVRGEKGFLGLEVLHLFPMDIYFI